MKRKYIVYLLAAVLLLVSYNQYSKINRLEKKLGRNNSETFYRMYAYIETIYDDMSKSENFNSKDITLKYARDFYSLRGMYYLSVGKQDALSTYIEEVYQQLMDLAEGIEDNKSDDEIDLIRRELVTKLEKGRKVIESIKNMSGGRFGENYKEWYRLFNEGYPKTIEEIKETMPL